MKIQRRHDLLAMLKASSEPHNGQSLADYFKVTRQIIVQDIALLRADGAPIISTNRGYLYKESPKTTYCHRLLKVKHKTKDIQAELEAIIDNGGRVKTILVEHPVYGELQTYLKLTCRRDIGHFLNQVDSNDFRPLSSLTDGSHYHLIEADSEDDLDSIEKSLAELGFLIKE